MHNIPDHSVENVIFSKVNLVNTFSLMFVSVLQILKDSVPVAEALAPFVTIGTGICIMLYNLVKAYKEFKTKDK